MGIDIINIFFVGIQLLNIVLSIILIVTGIFLFLYIRNIVIHIDKYARILIALHMLVSFFILYGYSLTGFDSQASLLGQFMRHLAIFTLGVINTIFQLSIYKIFFFIKSLSGKKDHQLSTDELEIKFVFDNIAKCSKSDNINYFNSK